MPSPPPPTALAAPAAAAPPPSTRASPAPSLAAAAPAAPASAARSEVMLRLLFRAADAAGLESAWRRESVCVGRGVSNNDCPDQGTLGVTPAALALCACLSSGCPRSKDPCGRRTLGGSVECRSRTAARRAPASCDGHPTPQALRRPPPGHDPCGRPTLGDSVMWDCSTPWYAASTAACRGDSCTAPAGANSSCGRAVVGGSGGGRCWGYQAGRVPQPRQLRLS